jgi:hypothetical protein
MVESLKPKRGKVLTMVRAIETLRPPQAGARPTAKVASGSEQPGFPSGAPTGDEYVKDVWGMILDPGVPDPQSDEWQLRQIDALLDAAGAPERDTVPQRLVAVADRWLGISKHPDSCQCMQCGASRKLIAESKILRIE